MNLSLRKQESVLELESRLRQRRLQAAAFSVICAFSILFALAALTRIPEFVAAQASGKLLGTIFFSLLVLLCVADNIRTHLFLWIWLRTVEQQKKKLQFSETIII